MREVYFNEKPETGDTGVGGGGVWGGGGAGGGGSSHWGGTWGESGGGDGGNGGGTGTDTVEPEWGADKLQAAAAGCTLRVSAGGALLLNDDGTLLICAQDCSATGTVSVKIVSEIYNAFAHASCIQIQLIYSQRRSLFFNEKRTLEYDLWPEDRKTGEGEHYSGNFPLPDPGEKLDVKAKWQAGHYDIEKFSKMQFSIFGINVGVKTLTLNTWRNIAEIQVMEDGIFFVNNIRGHLPRKKEDK